MDINKSMFIIQVFESSHPEESQKLWSQFSKEHPELTDSIGNSGRYVSWIKKQNNEVFNRFFAEHIDVRSG